jgi:triacylglycerol lipase
MPRSSLRTLITFLLGLLVAVTSALAFSSATAPAAAGPSYPYPTLGLSPVGANDWTCRRTANRPHPAVIVHGTFGDQQSLLDGLSLSLKQDGYCVFSLDYGDRATGPIAESAEQLGRFVDKVLAATGATKVEVVGHSQGGMMPRYWIKNLGGAAKVEDLVGLAPSNHGTTVQGSFGSGEWCVSCDQQMAGSDFLNQLNSGDETPGAVDYTQVVTAYDEVVVPYTSGFLASGRRSTNITLQDHCPADVADHLTIPLDRQAIRWVLDAFHRDGPADPDADIGCL